MYLYAKSVILLLVRILSQTKRQIMADSYSDQNWLLQSRPSLYLPLSYSIISSTHALLKDTCLLSAYQSIELLLISYPQTFRGRDLTPHRSATVVNSFPTPYTSSNFRFRTFVWDSSSSKFWGSAKNVQIC